jgi:two-component system response regulator
VIPYNKTILVVEDEEADRYFIGRAFRDNGVTGPVQFVTSGLEAIAYLMGEGKFADRTTFPYPTFIMTDLRMPGLDGLGVLEHLKHNPEWSVIPTVVFTSSSDPDDIKKSYMLGASSYHQKPADYPELRKQLKILHDYWMTCCVAAVDSTGRHLKTNSAGKLGERFPQPEGGTQKRRKPPRC